MKINLVMTICCLLLFSLTSSAFAFEPEQDDIVYYESPQSFQYKPFTQLSFSTGYRTDEKESLEHSPTYRATFYSFFSQYVGMKFGIGLNLSTKRPNSYYYIYSKTKAIQFESGFRFQDQLSSFAPFMEMGISMISYTNLPYENNHLKGGLFIVSGLELVYQEKIGFEFSFRHIFNNTPEHIIHIPPIDGTYYYRPGNDPYFNPTSFNFGINLKFK